MTAENRKRRREKRRILQAASAEKPVNKRKKKVGKKAHKKRRHRRKEKSIKKRTLEQQHVNDSQFRRVLNPLILNWLDQPLVTPETIDLKIIAGDPDEEIARYSNAVQSLYDAAPNPTKRPSDKR